MPEFNLTYYYNSLLRGDRVFFYQSFGSYGLISASLRVDNVHKGYFLPAGCEELLDMATGVDEFKIFFQDVLS
ncbi:MAG TPA: hypothetical protein PKJ63_01505 [Cyclobacteriaceae bacterium]|nr:hypothetical protein [Cyclobacteriaceae bacterium]